MWIVLECSKCNEFKVTYDFIKQKQCIFGVQRICKSCSAKYHKKNIKEWRSKNIESFKQKHNEYYKKYNKERRNSDINFKIMGNIRNLVSGSFSRTGFRKNTKLFKILGCKYDDFIFHIEIQFEKGMTWENHGKWHIDHIYPISLARDKEHLIELNHYTNLRPLWAKENISKGNKII